METTWIATARMQFCDEYEELLGEFLKVLAAWSQLREFRSQDGGAAETPEAEELFRADRSYVAALWALRMHSQKCVICSETLRVQMNGGGAPAARLSAR
jgi:hypothetical protein